MKSVALEKLYARYYPKHWPGERSFEELTRWIFNHLDVERIPLSSFSPHFRHRINYNAENIYIAQGFGLIQRKFDFVAYRLLKTERSVSYYKEDYTDKKQPNSYIYLILEKNIGVVECNHNRLTLEMRIAKGVSQQDYETKSSLMDAYITSLYFLDQNWY